MSLVIVGKFHEKSCKNQAKGIQDGKKQPGKKAINYLSNGRAMRIC